MSRADLAAIEERIVIAIVTATDRIVEAIRETGAEQNTNREAMANRIMERSAGFLRAALDEATPRIVVLDPPAANDIDDGHVPGPTTPPDGPANDHDPPSGRR